MMKRIVSMILLAAMLLVGTAAAEEADTGIWNLKEYVDEFKMPVGVYYIASEAISGTFSNSVTTDSELLAVIFCEENRGYHQLKIRLVEYGSYVVKNSSSKNRFYEMVMMDGSGERHYYGTTSFSIDAFCPKEGQDIWLGSDCTHEVIDALKEGGTVRFAITERDDPLTKYIFTIEDASGFADVYDQWLKQYGYLQ